MAGAETVWWELRRLRSEPPNMATASRRRRVFQAALEQSEQLLEAAARTKLATRPLLAFYGLSQGTRAILAAHTSAQAWEPNSHGLTTLDTGGPIRAVRIKDRGLGLFGSLASVMGSATLPSDTSFASLVKALPAIVDPAPCSEEDFAEALVLQPVALNAAGSSLTLSKEVSGWLWGLPVELLDHRDAQAAVRQYLASYPTLSDWTLATNNDDAVIHRATEHRMAVKLLWELATGTGSDQVRAAAVAANAITPPDRDGALFVPPSLAEPDRVIAPLVHWWAVLYALSVMVRYEPDSWRQQTDVDRSSDAVGFDNVVQVALAEVPKLLLQAIQSPTEWWSTGTASRVASNPQ